LAFFPTPLRVARRAGRRSIVVPLVCRLQIGATIRIIMMAMIGAL
jgi:hypothetical protein